LQKRQIRTSQTGGHRYSDTSPFSIHCVQPLTIDPELVGSNSATSGTGRKIL